MKIPKISIQNLKLQFGLGEIISGIIASFLFFIVKDVAGPFIGNFVKNLGNGIVVAYENAIAVMSAEMNTLNAISLVIMVFLSFVLSMPSLVIGKYSAKKFNDRLSKINVDEEEKKRMIKKRSKFADVLLIAVSLIGGMFLILTTIPPLSNKMKFDKSIDIISPYVEDMELKKFKSRWALMKSNDDYKALENDIQQIMDSLECTKK